jgi:hypothetical protein
MGEDVLDSSLVMLPRDTEFYNHISDVSIIRGGLGSDEREKNKICKGNIGHKQCTM